MGEKTVTNRTVGAVIDSRAVMTTATIDTSSVTTAVDDF